MPNIYTEYNDERVKQFHWGADPCRLRAHHADYADFSNPSWPPKIKP